MQYYKARAPKLVGTHWPRLIKKAFSQYKTLTAKSKRRPYVRSAYFKKQKVLNEIFFVQIKEDRQTDQKWLISVFPLDK